MMQQFLHKRGKSGTTESDTETNPSEAQLSAVSTPTSRIQRRTDTQFDSSPPDLIRPSCGSLQAVDTIGSPRSDDLSSTLLSPPRSRVRAGLQSPGSKSGLMSGTKLPKPFAAASERPAERVHRFIQYDTPSTRFHARSATSFRSLSPAQNTPKRPRRAVQGISRAAGSFHMLDMPACAVAVEGSVSVYSNICSMNNTTREQLGSVTRRLRHVPVSARVVSTSFSSANAALTVLLAQISDPDNIAILTSVLIAVQKLALLQCEPALRHLSVCDRCVGLDAQVDELYLQFTSLLQYIWSKMETNSTETFPFREDSQCYCTSTSIRNPSDECDTLPLDEFESYSTKTDALSSMLNRYTQQLFAELCQYNMNVVQNVDAAPASSVEVVMHHPLRILLSEIAKLSAQLDNDLDSTASNVLFTLQVYSESSEPTCSVNFTVGQKHQISACGLGATPLALLALAVSSDSELHVRPLVVYEQNSDNDRDFDEIGRELLDHVENIADKVRDVLERQELSGSGVSSKWFLYLSGIGCVVTEVGNEHVIVDGVQLLQLHAECSRVQVGGVRLVSPFSTTIPDIQLQEAHSCDDSLDAARLYRAASSSNGGGVRALGAFSTVSRVMDRVSGHCFALKTITKSSRVHNSTSSMRSFNEFSVQSYVYNDERKIPGFCYPTKSAVFLSNNTVLDKTLDILRAKKYILQPHHALQCDQTLQLIFAWATRGSLYNQLSKPGVMLCAEAGRQTESTFGNRNTSGVGNVGLVFHQWKYSVMSIQSDFNDIVQIDRLQYPLLFDVSQGKEVSLKNLFALSLQHEEIQPNHQFCTYGTLQLLKECSRGLSRVHAKGMVHMDIKPDNILYTDVVNSVCESDRMDASLLHVLLNTSGTEMLQRYATACGVQEASMQLQNCAGKLNRYVDESQYSGVFTGADLMTPLSTSHHAHAVLGDFGLARTVDLGLSAMHRQAYFLNLQAQYPRYCLDSHLSMIAVPTVRRLLDGILHRASMAMCSDEILTLPSVGDFQTTVRDAVSAQHETLLPEHFQTPAVAQIPRTATVGCVVPLPGLLPAPASLSAFFKEAFSLLHSLDAMEGDQRYLCLVLLQGEQDKYVSKPVRVRLSQTQTLTQALSQHTDTRDLVISVGKVWTEDWSHAAYVSSGMPVHVDGVNFIPEDPLACSVTSNRDENALPTQRCAASLDACDVFALGASLQEIYSNLPTPKSGHIWSQIRSRRLYSYQMHTNELQDEESVLHYNVADDVNIRNSKYAYILQYMNIPAYKQHAQTAADAASILLHARIGGLLLQAETIAVIHSILESFRHLILLHNEQDPYVMYTEHIDKSHLLPLHCQQRQDQSCLCCNYAYKKHSSVQQQLQLAAEFSSLCVANRVPVSTMNVCLEDIEFAAPKTTCKLVAEIMSRLRHRIPSPCHPIPTGAFQRETDSVFDQHVIHVLCRQINALLAPTVHTLLGSMLDSIPVIRPMATQLALHAQEAQDCILDRVLFVHQVVSRLLADNDIIIIEHDEVPAYSYVEYNDIVYTALDTQSNASNVLLFYYHFTTCTDTTKHSNVMQSMGLTANIVDSTTVAAILQYITHSMVIMGLSNKCYIALLRESI